jgi:FkbM family methyltransferase
MLFDVLKFKLLPKIRKLRRDYSDNSRVSYAQCGEDLIMQQVFIALGIKRVAYLDIGAHHPTHLSNTYLFYRSGGQGVCVEPDPGLFRQLVAKRPRDIHLNCGVGASGGEADFYRMTSSTLSTFSRAEVERYQAKGKQRVEKVIRIELKPIDDIIAQNFNVGPNLVSLDVEGLEYEVLQSFDFRRYRPQVFCLETLTYAEDKSERKLTEIIELMRSRGYFPYADTYINTIFVENGAWENRP